MKANELMIGDWVYLEHTEDGIAPYGEPMQWQRDDYDYTDEFVETRIKPIPLTPEILRKNGFKKNRDAVENIDTYMSNYFPFMLIKKNREWSFATYDSATEIIYLFSISYVYELQHALRLCGTEKEITI